MLITITNNLETSPKLLFTGHSARGGVAALICAHIRNHCPEIVQTTRTIPCITFAAPPILTPLSAVKMDLDLFKSLSLNIVNHGDIVPRAEKNHIRSVLALYRECEEHPSNDFWGFGTPTTFNYGQIIFMQDTSKDDKSGEQVHM